MRSRLLDLSVHLLDRGDRREGFSAFHGAHVARAGAGPGLPAGTELGAAVFRYLVPLTLDGRNLPSGHQQQKS